MLISLLWWLVYGKGVLRCCFKAVCGRESAAITYDGLIIIMKLYWITVRAWTWFEGSSEMFGCVEESWWWLKPLQRNYNVSLNLIWDRGKQNWTLSLNSEWFISLGLIEDLKLWICHEGVNFHIQRLWNGFITINRKITSPIGKCMKLVRLES